jgi:hypothetical protein
VRDQVSYICNTTEKMTDFYILIFKVFNRKIDFGLLESYVYNNLKTGKHEACITYDKEDKNARYLCEDIQVWR